MWDLAFNLESGPQCVVALIMNEQMSRAAAVAAAAAGTGLFTDVFKAAYFVHHIKLETKTFCYSKRLVE